MRIRVLYKKDGILIFLSILDIVRMWERLLQRCDFDLKYTEGFNPKPKMDFCPALPVGVIGENEVMDFYLNENYDIDYIFEELKNKAKDVVIIKKIREINENSKSLSSISTHFEVEIEGENIRNFKGEKIILKEENLNNKKVLIFEKDKLSIKKLIEIFKENNVQIKKLVRKNIYCCLDGKLKPIFDIDL